jgi:hypothetical protein
MNDELRWCPAGKLKTGRMEDWKIRRMGIGALRASCLRLRRETGDVETQNLVSPGNFSPQAFKICPKDAAVPMTND